MYKSVPPAASSTRDDEKARKMRLLRFFSLVSGAIVCGGLLYFATRLIFFSYFDPFLLGVLSIGIVGVSGSYILAGKGLQNLASPLLVATTALIVAAIFARYGTVLPYYFMFMIPIAISLVLLETRGVAILTVLCVLFSFGMYLIEDILQWYIPYTSTSMMEKVGTNIFLVLFVLPGVTAIITAPAKSHMRLLKIKNESLTTALLELELRQKSSQTFSESVLQLSAELKVTAGQQTASSQEQASVSTQIQTSISELSATATGIADIAGKARLTSEQVDANSHQIEETTLLSVDQSQKGIEAIKETRAVIHEVAALYQRLQDTLVDLKLKSTNMRRILDLLSSIASETHLLSLNAAIEAAGAGEYGTRFGVVAQEVKNLAERSNQANREVVAIIEEIEHVTGDAVNTVEEGYQKAGQMEKIAWQAGDVIQEMRSISEKAMQQVASINEASDEVRQLLEVIGQSTTQQRGASEQVLSAISQLSAVAQQNAFASIKISTSAAALEGMATNLTTSLST